MSPTPAVHVAFTSPINPEGAQKLSKAQVWAGLERKVRHAEEFIPKAVSATDVLSVEKDEHGREVVTREVIFTEGGRRVKEVVTSYEPIKIEFKQADGSRVLNIISDSADGQLYLTYQFEWLMDANASEETKKANTEKWEAMSKGAVESSIKALRDMVADGRISV